MVSHLWFFYSLGATMLRGIGYVLNDYTMTLKAVTASKAKQSIALMAEWIASPALRVRNDV